MMLKAIKQSSIILQCIQQKDMHTEKEICEFIDTENLKYQSVALPYGIKKKALDKLNILKTDYNNFSHLENNNKYNEPLKVLKTEIELLEKFEY